MQAEKKFENLFETEILTVIFFSNLDVGWEEPNLEFKVDRKGLK